ncbi:MAG TPA: ABC transporter permease [Acidobacteriaceae bacterium]|jgi:ABC-2 type transport system permease protein|nr:ABC transporter permease [Acidobacteriaceae bacterium]
MAATAIALASESAPQSLGLGYYVRLFRKETRYEFVRLLRTKAFSLSVIGFPVMFYLLFGSTNHGNFFARYLVASYSCMGVVSACLFGIGMGISMERAQGWLDLKQASPMPRLAYLMAKVLSCAAFSLVIVGVLFVLGITVGGATFTASEALRLSAVVLAAAPPFAAMGLFLSLLVPANSGPGIMNLIYLPMSFASGFWMPMRMLPHWLQAIAPFLPTFHLAQLALGIFGFAQPSGSMLVHWEALAGFTLLMLGAAWILFTRSEAKA